MEKSEPSGESLIPVSYTHLDVYKRQAGTVKLKNHLCSFYGVMLEKVEVDLNLLLNKSWFVALCSDSEMLLLKND